MDMECKTFLQMNVPKVLLGKLALLIETFGTLLVYR